MECIEYWKVKGQATAAESPVGTYPFSRSVGAGWLINRQQNPWGFSFPAVVAAAVDLFEPPSTVTFAAAREIENPCAPPPPTAGTAPERMRVKTLALGG
jgi:hypothetical protein